MHVYLLEITLTQLQLLTMLESQGKVTLLYENNNTQPCSMYVHTNIQNLADPVPKIIDEVTMMVDHHECLTDDCDDFPLAGTYQHNGVSVWVRTYKKKPRNSNHGHLEELSNSKKFKFFRKLNGGVIAYEYNVSDDWLDIRLNGPTIDAVKKVYSLVLNGKIYRKKITKNRM